MFNLGEIGPSLDTPFPRIQVPQKVILQPLHMHNCINANNDGHSIFWQFSNSLLNCNESGCDNIDAFVREQIISYSDVNGNITVESTLQIITNGLSPSNFVVACVIIQDAPVGGGSPDSVFSTLLILNDAGILCMHGYTIIVMTSHVHIIHAEAHTISASTSNVTLFTEEGMFSDTVNTQTHASGTHV